MTLTASVRRSRSGLPTGRFIVDADRSRLDVTASVGGWASVRGRFTDVRGHVDVASESAECVVIAEIATASLTSGSRRWDRVLTAAGLVDAAANPVLHYRSTAVSACGSENWRVEGVLGTRSGAAPLAFALTGPVRGRDGRARLRARATLPTVVGTGLLGRPDAAALLGPDLVLDLQVEVLAADLAR